MAIVAMVSVVFEGVEGATHVVTDEIFVRAADVRGRGVDEGAAAVGEPAIDADVHGDCGRRAAYSDRRIERELQRGVGRSAVDEGRAIEGAFDANACVGELRIG